MLRRGDGPAGPRAGDRSARPASATSATASPTSRKARDVSASSRSRTSRRGLGRTGRVGRAARRPTTGSTRRRQELERGGWWHERPACMRRPVLITGGAGFIGSQPRRPPGAARAGTSSCSTPSRGRGSSATSPGCRQRHGERIRAVIGRRPRRGARRRRPRGTPRRCSTWPPRWRSPPASSTRATTSTINLGGTLNVLEALRARGAAHAGDLRLAPTRSMATSPTSRSTLDGDAYAPVDPSLRATASARTRPLDFHTPYGCSKGAADQYVLDYARSFGLPTAVLRMSCIYGPRQMGTEDQGWVAHFLHPRAGGRADQHLWRRPAGARHARRRATRSTPTWRAGARIGEVGGAGLQPRRRPGNAVSLRQLIAHIETARRPRGARSPSRTGAPGDQRYYVSDPAAARPRWACGARGRWRDGVARLAGLAGARTLAPVRPRRPGAAGVDPAGAS